MKRSVESGNDDGRNDFTVRQPEKIKLRRTERLESFQVGSKMHHNLMLRSAPQERVSKHGHEHRVCCPPFETAAMQPPQGEVEWSM